MDLTLNIPESDLPRIIIVGAGFGGLTLARKLRNQAYQVILLDRQNYHQFQPLFYQVAMAGLEPSAISFPLRKTFQNSDNVFIRVCTLESVDRENKKVVTSQGNLDYDALVIATGAVTNFFGNSEIEKHAFGLKTVGESLDLRNHILTDFEKALQTVDYDDRQPLIDIVIVGGGPTGVEMAGALAEMRKYILPKDYRELNHQEVDIHLIQGGENLLQGMDDSLGEAAVEYLRKMDVKVLLNTRVDQIAEDHVVTADGQKIVAGKVVWAAGVTCEIVEGLEREKFYGRGNRLKVNSFNQLAEDNYIFALGDAAMMESEDLQYGHPQVAQPAIQQAKNLARNLRKSQGDLSDTSKWKPFAYKDYGTMATVGRNKALVELPFFKFKGFFAWVMWLLVHLYALIGVKNRVVVMLNWWWNYITYDQSLRLIIRPKNKKGQESRKT